MKVPTFYCLKKGLSHSCSPLCPPAKLACELLGFFSLCLQSFCKRWYCRHVLPCLTLCHSGDLIRSPHLWDKPFIQRHTFPTRCCYSNWKWGIPSWQTSLQQNVYFKGLEIFLPSDFLAHYLDYLHYQLLIRDDKVANPKEKYSCQHKHWHLWNTRFSLSHSLLTQNTLPEEAWEEPV